MIVVPVSVITYGSGKAVSGIRVWGFLQRSSSIDNGVEVLLGTEALLFQQLHNGDHRPDVGDGRSSRDMESRVGRWAFVDCAITS